MDNEASVHAFDEGRAERFVPRDGFVKTAVLVEPVDPEARTVITTSFGEQTLIGSFYAVADGGTSYGSARREFEGSHVQVGPNRWAKATPVDAYRADDEWVVDTVVDGFVESRVTAHPGDWIVRQGSGEVMVLSADDFAERYRHDD